VDGLVVGRPSNPRFFSVVPAHCRDCGEDSDIIIPRLCAIAVTARAFKDAKCPVCGAASDRVYLRSEKTSDR
jgi:hypothetical protein